MTKEEAYRIADGFYHSAAATEMVRLSDRKEQREMCKQRMADRIMEIAVGGKPPNP